MNATQHHIVCPHCAGTNRLPVDRDAARAKCGRCHKPLFVGRPADVRLEAFDKQVKSSDIPLVVDFWAEWCGPCKMMAPAFEKVASELEPRVRFLKLDTEAEPQLAARYQIRGIPTTIIFRNGAEIARRAGAMDAGTLSAWLQPYAG